LRDFGDEGGVASSIRGRFVRDGLSGLRGEVGEGEEEEEADAGDGDNGELFAECGSSRGQRREAEFVWTERGAGNLEGLGERSCMEAGGWEHTISEESRGSSESALRLRGREWRGIDW